MSATISSCLYCANLLEQVSESARLDVELLLAFVLGKDRAYLYTWPEVQISEKQHEHFQFLIARRGRGEPIAYILGGKAFWSLDLVVNQSTLIPRPETELLVELALEKLSSSQQSILDLGTGTGAVALAIAKEKPQCSVMGVDLVLDAVNLARQNAVRNQLENVVFSQSDWFSALTMQKFDLIVSNPPYVDEDDPLLYEGDVRFEPRRALVASDRGYADIRIIISRAKDFLLDSAWLMVEHGWQQGEGVRALFAEEEYKDIQTYKDLAGHDRVTLGRRREEE